MSLSILNLVISCSYYNVRDVASTKETISENLKDFNSTEKYVVIHSNDESWYLSNMIINDDEQNISGSILPINSLHEYKKVKEGKRVQRYIKGKTNPFNELHIYLKTPTSFNENTEVKIPLIEIRAISVNDKNTGRTIANIALTTVSTVFVVSLIALALKSSCPFVYIKNGEEYDFIGELYPGVITANMQSDDFLPLPNFTIENNEYILKVSNLLKEIQHTDQLQLQVINHKKNIEVLLDNAGKIQTFKNIQAPIKVTLDNGNDNLAVALKKDNNFYSFNTQKSTFNSTRSIDFVFDNPKNIKKSKLFLTAKNSVWLDYIFGKFNEQFGLYYSTFQEDQQDLSREEMKNWANAQNIPLSVFIKTKGGWQLVDKINTVGPMAMRDIAIPIDLKEVYGDSVQIKLETGFMFWEVDYIGMDFSKNIELNINHINPSQAIDQKGNNVTPLLLEADSKYFTQPNIGDEVVVTFPVENYNPELTQTVFLKNKGYYNYIRDYKGMPDFENLQAFREDNTFTRFSEKAYFEFVNFDLNTLAYHE